MIGAIALLVSTLQIRQWEDGKMKTLYDWQAAFDGEFASKFKCDG